MSRAFGMDDTTRPSSAPVRGGRVIDRDLDCDDCVCTGDGNERIGIEEGANVRLTPNQIAVLDPRMRLGSGTFACVYRRSDGDVVKFTRDRTDVSAVLLAQQHPRAVRLRRAWELEQGGVWALVTEYLRPIPRRGYGWMNYALEAAYNAAVAAWPRNTKRRADYPSVSDMMALEEAGCPGRKCKEMLRGLLQLHWFLAQHHLRLVDFHIDNIGLGTDGEWRMFDLGFNKSPERPDLPMLAGARPR